MASAPEPEDYLIERIRQGLVADPRVGELDVHARFANGELFISGNVPTRERRDAIAVVAAEIAQDVVVHNEVEVTPGTAPDGEEVLS